MPDSYIDENILLTQEDRVAVYQNVVKTSHDGGKVIPVDRNGGLLTTDWGSLVKKVCWMSRTTNTLLQNLSNWQH